MLMNRDMSNLIVDLMKRRLAFHSNLKKKKYILSLPVWPFNFQRKERREENKDQKLQMYKQRVRKNSAMPTYYMMLHWFKIRLYI